MPRFKRVWILALAAVAAPGSVLAAQPRTGPAASAAASQKAVSRAKVDSKAGSKADGRIDPRVRLAHRIPGATVQDLHASPVKGIYELSRGTDIAYVTADGHYAFTGDLYDLRSNQNLSEQQRRTMRRRLIAAIPQSQMVVYGPKDARYTVTVFTDVDCAYCRKLHSQMAQYNRLGIRIRYLAFPRTGPHTESWYKAEEVWCAPDRKAALTRAKLGEKLHTRPCSHNPVAREYALGRKLGLTGTPVIILSDGELLPGYVPPEQLAQDLRAAAAEAR